MFDSVCHITLFAIYASFLHRGSYMSAPESSIHVGEKNIFLQMF